MRTLLISAAAIALAACGSPSAPAATDTASETPAATAETTPAEATAGPAEADVTYGPAGTYALDLTHSSLTWKVSHFGLSNYTGRFTDFDATLVMDPENTSATSLTVTIDPTSVETDYPADYKASHADSGYETWNEDLSRDPKWLNSDAFGEITFTATEITKVSANTGKVTGDLTFLGVTKPVTLDVTYNGAAEMFGSQKVGFSATTTLKRSDFGEAAYAPNIGDEVEIIIETEFALAN